MDFDYNIVYYLFYCHSYVFTFSTYIYFVDFAMNHHKQYASLVSIMADV